MYNRPAVVRCTRVVGEAPATGSADPPNSDSRTWDASSRLQRSNACIVLKDYALVMLTRIRNDIPNLCWRVDGEVNKR